MEEGDEWKKNTKHTHLNVYNKKHGGDYSTSDQASNCRKYDCFYDYCDYFCLFFFFFISFFVLAADVDFIYIACRLSVCVACARVECIWVCLCCSYDCSSFVVFSFLYLCFKQLSHILKKWTNHIRTMWSVKSTC